MDKNFNIEKAYYLFLLIRKSEEKIVELYNSDKIKRTGTTTLTPPTTKTATVRSQSSLKYLFHSEANCRFIYANPDGYAVADGGQNGGYLIQATSFVFATEKEIEFQSLDHIINQIRKKTRQIVGTGTMENIQDVNQMNFQIYFNKSTTKK